MKLLEYPLWLALAAWIGMAILPASLWYEPGDMRVDDIPEGAPLVLNYSGGAVREFIGSYSVIVTETSRREIVGEDRSARFRYQVDAVRPVPLTIEWWAPGDDRMHSLPKGSYQMKTCWTVHDAFWGAVPGKTVCIESNIFKVI